MAPLSYSADVYEEWRRFITQSACEDESIDWLGLHEWTEFSEVNAKLFMAMFKNIDADSAIVTAADETINGFDGLMLKIEPHGDHPVKLEQVHKYAAKITVPREKEYDGRVRDVMVTSARDGSHVTVWIPGKSVADYESA